VLSVVSNIHPIVVMALALGLQPRGMGWKVPCPRHKQDQSQIHFLDEMEI